MLDQASEVERKRKLVILGGGTAGWLAALILGDAAQRADTPIDVTVVESSKIPTIGVGEGTTAVFKSLLDYFGFDEAEFLRETRGTIKYGIRHKDWAELGVTYDGPIDDPHAVMRGLPAGAELLNLAAVATGIDLWRIHLFGHLMRGGKAPVDAEGKRVGPFQHAYHIDAAAVGRYLRSKARHVSRIDGTMATVRRNTDGTLAALVLDDGRQVDGDFFIDCTGFRRALIEKEMNAKWVSYGDCLPVNRAMPFWLDHDPQAEIAPVTLAWAQKAGWMWQIPVQDRIGCGYVYSDRYTTPDAAKAEIEAVLGHRIEPRADLRFDAGRIDAPWRGNVLAVGLAQSFLEPLEATSIHGTVVQMMLFSQDYMKTPFRFTEAERQSYNQRIARQLDDFRTFINVHYKTRRTEPFWVEARETSMHEEAQQRLSDWTHKMPSASDFTDSLTGLPHIESQLYYPVLAGLGLLDRDVAQRDGENYAHAFEQARALLPKIVSSFDVSASKAIGHRAYLDSLA